MTAIVEHFMKKGHLVSYYKSGTSESHYITIDGLQVRISDHKGKGMKKHKFNLVTTEKHSKSVVKGKSFYNEKGLNLMLRDIEEELE